MNKYFFEKISYPCLVKILLRNKFWKYVKELEKLQFADYDTLIKRSEEKIKEILVHSYKNVLFYKKKFDEYGVNPRDFQFIEDLQKFPIVTKKEFKQYFPKYTKAKDMPNERCYLGSTSGSTGTPFQFFVDRESKDIRLASRIFFNYWAGISPVSRRVWICSPRLNKNSLVKNKLQNMVFSKIKGKIAGFLLGYKESKHISSFGITNDNLKEIIDLLSHYNPDYVEGYASALIKIAKEMKQCGTFRIPNLKTIISTSDTLCSVNKKLIENAFRCKVVNRYGSLEFSGSVAQDCPNNVEGLHVNTELVWLEVVDSKGKQVSQGKSGKIIITDLHNYVMPFIRYEMGDYAIWGGKCKCGRGFPILKKIEGRDVEFIKIRSGKKISSVELGHALFVLRDYYKYIKDYQAVQNTMDELNFLIVPEKEFNLTVKENLVKDLKKLLNNDTTINISIVSEIGLESSGKRLIIKSNI